MARNKNLELFRVNNFLLIFLASNQNKRVAIIELRNENEQNVISYSQLRKSKISLVKKFQTVYLFPK